MVENIALFDMDGTLADYDGGLRRELAEIANPADPTFDNLHDTPKWMERRIRVVRARPGWWESLEPLPLGFDVLRMALQIGYTTRILTKGPRKTQSAWTEKVLWCQQHVEPLDPDMQVTITEDKGLVYGKVLVDDYPAYMDRWLEFRPRGLGVMPAQPWNEGYSHPNVIRFDGQNGDDLKAALQKAFDRQPREEL